MRLIGCTPADKLVSARMHARCVKTAFWHGPTQSGGASLNIYHYRTVVNQSRRVFICVQLRSSSACG